MESGDIGMRESRVRILYSGISFVVLLFLLAAAVFGACRKEDRAGGIPVGVSNEADTSMAAVKVRRCREIQ